MYDKLLLIDEMSPETAFVFCEDSSLQQSACTPARILKFNQKNVRRKLFQPFMRNSLCGLLCVKGEFFVCDEKEKISNMRFYEFFMAAIYWTISRREIFFDKQ